MAGKPASNLLGLILDLTRSSAWPYNRFVISIFTVLCNRDLEGI